MSVGCEYFVTQLVFTRAQGRQRDHEPLGLCGGRCRGFQRQRFAPIAAQTRARKTLLDANIESKLDLLRRRTKRLTVPRSGIDNDGVRKAHMRGEHREGSRKGDEPMAYATARRHFRSLFHSHLENVFPARFSLAIRWIVFALVRVVTRAVIAFAGTV